MLAIARRTPGTRTKDLSEQLLKYAFEFKRLAGAAPGTMVAEQFRRMSRLCVELAVEKIEIEVGQKLYSPHRAHPNAQTCG
jgi:hypothetical protein